MQVKIYLSNGLTSGICLLLKKYNFGATFFVCKRHIKGIADSLIFMLWHQISQLNKGGLRLEATQDTIEGLVRLPAQLKDEIRYIEDKCNEYRISKPTSFAFPGNRSDLVSPVVLHKMGYQFTRAGETHLYNPQQDKPFDTLQFLRR